MWLRKSRKEPVLSHISMKNLPELERPYERFQILGAEALSDAELLAIILKTGTKDYTALDLARDLLSECQGNLLNLYEIGYEQLLERRGIGPVKATQLKAIAELSKRIARTGRGYHLSMNCPSSIADYYMEELRHRREEAFMAAFFDSKCKFLGDSVIATGSISYAYVSPMELFRKALLRNAVMIVILHNHPSGDPTPSTEDKKLTEQIRAGADWVNTTCPCCGGPAKRETDTMPQWAGSSWYFLRYTDPHNDKALASPEALKYWLPVDWYNGGMEHTTLHLLYSRFWHKFLYDQGVVPTPEPYQKRTSHGMILGENGEKMSKSRGNVVNPDDIVQEYGADTLRTYEMFIGAFDLAASWSEDGVKGCRRFLDRVWKLQDLMTDEEGYSKDLETKMHQTIKKVSNDFENLKYNTAIAAMMTLLNDFYKKGSITRGELKTLIILLNPVAPHITEEMWQIIGCEGRVYQQTWPEFDEAKTVESSVEIAVQINGKVKGTLGIQKDDPKDQVIAKAKEVIADKLTGNIVKEIYVPGRLVNIVMK